MKKGILAYLTPIFAIILAVTVGFFSVSGLSKLFAGAAMEVIILGATLESVKLVGTALLHVYWKKFTWYIKTYMIIGIIVLMGVTSAGVYGLLTSGYQETASSLSVSNKEIQLVENKKSIFDNRIETLDEQREYKNKQINSLVTLRSQQETRLDSLLANNHWVNAKRTQEDIDEANDDIKSLQSEVDTILIQKGAFNDSIANLDIKIMNLESNNEAASELGPLMYVAELTGKPMDVVINWLMMLLIFVADPFAVVLVIATTKIWHRTKKDKSLVNDIDQSEFDDIEEESRKAYAKYALNQDEVKRVHENVERLRKDGKLPKIDDDSDKDEPTAFANSEYRENDNIQKYEQSPSLKKAFSEIGKKKGARKQIHPDESKEMSAEEYEDLLRKVEENEIKGKDSRNSPPKN